MNASEGVLHVKGVPEDVRRSFRSVAAQLGISNRDAVIDAMRMWTKANRKKKEASDNVAS